MRTRGVRSRTQTYTPPSFYGTYNSGDMLSAGEPRRRQRCCRKPSSEVTAPGRERGGGHGGYAMLCGAASKRLAQLRTTQASCSPESSTAAVCTAESEQARRVTSRALVVRILRAAGMAGSRYRSRGFERDGRGRGRLRAVRSLPRFAAAGSAFRVTLRSAAEAAGRPGGTRSHRPLRSDERGSCRSRSVRAVPRTTGSRWRDGEP